MKLSVRTTAFSFRAAARHPSGRNALGDPCARRRDAAGRRRGLALSATDTEIALQSSLPAEVEQEGTLLLPARLLLDIVRVADGDDGHDRLPRPTRAW